VNLVNVQNDSLLAVFHSILKRQKNCLYQMSVLNIYRINEMGHMHCWVIRVYF